MNKRESIILFFLLIAFGLTSVIHANAEDVDHNIDLNEQTIYEREYENNGITGMYNIDMFIQDDENIFTQKNYDKHEYYINLKKMLFNNKIEKSKSDNIANQVENLNLFSSVDYHFNPYEKKEPEIDLFYLAAIMSMLMSGIIGFIIAKVFISKRKGKV